MAKEPEKNDKKLRKMVKTEKMIKRVDKYKKGPKMGPLMGG